MFVALYLPNTTGDCMQVDCFAQDQVGNVASARQAALDGADVIVAQGADAGGHQYAQTSGLISLVPEVRDMLDAEFSDRQIALLAAGGIADGRGVAAALALGL